MTRKLVLAGLVLMAAPCLFAQDAPPAPNGPGGPPPPRAPHAPKAQRPRHDDGGRPGGDMHGELGGMPMGPWWRHPEVVTKLSLTPDQVKRIDDQFMKTREQLIDMHASLEKQQLELEPLLSANPVDQSKALAQISKIADTRAELEKTDAKMLLSIRAVLTADQWTKMRQMHEMHGGPMDGHGDMHAPMAPGQRGHGPSEEPLQ